MKWTFKHFVLFLFFQPIIGQNNEVKITTEQTESGLTFYAKNNNEIRHEITLDISAKNLSGYQGPITKMVEGKDSIQMVQLSFQKDQPWSYQTNYTYTPKPTKDELEKQKDQLKQEMFDFLDAKTNKIIVFYAEGCSRSTYAREMLEKRKISVKYLNATKNEHYYKVMLELLRLQEPDLKRVGYPVFLINNKLDNDIENLRWYIKDLVSNTD
nr:hypothetical protein [uncultured Allomuricauda sp.]